MSDISCCIFVGWLLGWADMVDSIFPYSIINFRVSDLSFIFYKFGKVTHLIYTFFVTF